MGAMREENLKKKWAVRPSGPGEDFDLRRAREMSISWIVGRRGRGVCTMGEGEIVW